VSNPATKKDLAARTFLVLLKNTRFVRDNCTNQTKEGYRGQKPVSKKLLVRVTIPQYRFNETKQHTVTLNKQTNKDRDSRGLTNKKKVSFIELVTK